MIKRTKSDKGDGITVMGLFMIVVVLLVALLIVDVSKMVYIRNTYINHGQIAANTAIREQNGIGGLDITAANRAIQEYMLQRDPQSFGVLATNETAAFRRLCDTGEFPRIEISFDTERRVGQSTIGPRFVSYGGQLVTESNREEFFINEFRVIRLNITDVSDGDFSGLFRNHCQTHTFEVSAIITDALVSE